MLPHPSTLSATSTLHRDGVQEWEQGCFKLAPRTIVRGVVTGLHARGAFVRLEFGPTAFLHEDAVSHAKFRRLGDVLQVRRARGRGGEGEGEGVF